jgi:hypothetical protein
MLWVIPPASCAATLVSTHGIEQGGLAVIDMPHDGDDRGSRAGGPPGDPLLFNFLKDFLFVAHHMVASAPKGASAISTAVWPSSVWLMVAKIPLSRRRLITSLARVSSFSDSSLMAMPFADRDLARGRDFFRNQWPGRRHRRRGATPHHRRLCRPYCGRPCGGAPGATCVPAAGRDDVGCMGRGSPGRRVRTGRACAGFGAVACG